MNSDSLRVLFVIHKGFLGGTGRAMTALIDGLLHEKKYRPLLLAPPGELIDSARQRGIPAMTFEFDTIGRSINPWSWIQSFRQFWYGIHAIRRILRHRGIGIVHACSLKSVLLAGLAARLTGVKVVFHVHDYLDAGLFRPQYIRAAALLSDKIVANSRSVSDIFPASQRRKVTVVYNEVCGDAPLSPAIRRRMRRESAVALADPLIGYVGRIHPEKGIKTLIDGFGIVREKLPTARLWIVGGAAREDKGYLASTIARARTTAGAGRIVFWGWRTDAQALMACCDVLVVPSKKEPFGLVTVEAMLAGVPVVASAAGGTLEIIRDGITGLLFPPGDNRALADAVVRLLTNRSLAEQLVERAREDAKKRFGQRQFIDGMKKIYDSLSGKMISGTIEMALDLHSPRH